MRGAKQKDMFDISDLRRREILHLMSVCLFFSPGGRGYSDIFIRCLGYLLGFKILNFIIFWVFQKTEYFWGCKDFVDIF